MPELFKGHEAALVYKPAFAEQIIAAVLANKTTIDLKADDFDVDEGAEQEWPDPPCHVVISTDDENDWVRIHYTHLVEVPPNRVDHDWIRIRYTVTHFDAPNIDWERDPERINEPR